MPTRNATAVWEGGLKDGKGSFNGESGGISGSYSRGSRFENAKGTNPANLIAAAESACYTMGLSAGLEKNGSSPTKLEAAAGCTIEPIPGAFRITTMKLDVKSTV